MKKLIIIAVLAMAISGCYPITNDNPKTEEIDKDAIYKPKYLVDTTIDNYVEVEAMKNSYGKFFVYFKGRKNNEQCMNVVNRNEIGCGVFTPIQTAFILKNFDKFSDFKAWNDSISKIPVTNNLKLKYIHQGK